MPPILSIIIPVYNRADSIERCIESVLNQTSNNYELILIDDASTDESWAIIAKYTEKHKNLRAIHIEKNSGVNYARNRGIEKATGKYVLFLDSDDYLAQNALQEVMSVIEKSEYNHYLFCISYRYETLKEYGSSVINYDAWLNGSFTGDFVHVVNAERIKEYHFFEEFRAFEILNWLRIYRDLGPQLFIPKIVVVVDRNRNDSITNQRGMTPEKYEQKFNFYLKFHKLYCSDYRKFGLHALLHEMMRKAVIIGIALRRYNDVQQILQAESIPSKKYKLLMQPFISSLLLKLLTFKSALR